MGHICALGVGQCRYTSAILAIAYNINVANRYIRPMPITLKRTLVKIGGSLRLTIPPEIADILKVKEGDVVEYAATNGDVVIRKART